MTGLLTDERVVRGMSDAEYHSRPELSSTGARKILHSPARFKYDMEHREPKVAFDVGHAVHAKVLGEGAEIVVIDAPDWRTKAAREERDAAYASGLTPVLRAQADEIDGMVEQVLAHPEARKIFEAESGDREISLFARDEETGVDLRARFDYLDAGRIGADLKTTSGEASPQGFAKSAATYGYDVQQEHYEDVLQTITGERTPMRFVVVEKSAPYLVGVYQLDPDFVALGKRRARAARSIYAACVAADSWPGYSSEVQYAIPPMWLIYETDDRFPEEMKF